MEEIYRDREYFPHYCQIALLDNTPEFDFPEWHDNHAYAHNQSGVAVGLPSSIGEFLIDVTIFRGPGEPPGYRCFAGEITVGDHGLLVGIIDFVPLAWPAGKTQVLAAVDAEDLDAIRRITFVLTHVST